MVTVPPLPSPLPVTIVGDHEKAERLAAGLGAAAAPPKAAPEEPTAADDGESTPGGGRKKRRAVP